MNEPLEHGGGLLAAQRAFPDALKPWLDLSTGINPAPYPVGDLAPDAWTRLPQVEEIAELEAIAARTYGVSDAACVVAAPGAQSLIQLLPRIFPARTVAVLGPTYAEHARCWRASGARVQDVGRVEEMQDSDVTVVVHPNNPDGRTLPCETLRSIARSRTKRGALLVVDESFADVLPRESSLAPYASEDRIVVLRSFGKFYGLAGLRLGFAIASPGIADGIREALGPWAVSGPAVEIGQRALGDADWRETTMRRLRADADRLDVLLAGGGLPLVGGTRLFRLVTHPHAHRVHKTLCRQGVLVRAFADHETWLRVGVPGREEDWRRLTAAVRHV